MHTAKHALARAHRTGRNMLLAATAALLLGTVPALAAPPTYRIAFLGDFGGTMSGQAVNNSGHVVGYFRPMMGSTVYGWVFDGVSSTNLLPSPTKWQTYATDINDSNVLVAGTMMMPGNISWASIWDTNTNTGNNSPTGVSVSPTTPLRINNNGWVAGALNSVAAVYDGAIIHSLGTLGGTSSRATGLNNLNTIVGISAIGGNQTAPHAFLFDTAMHDLGAFRAYDISDNGLVVGGVGGNGGFGVKVSGGSHAVVYDGSLHDLGTLSGFSSSELLAVNTAGQAVGNAAHEAGGHTYYSGMLYDGTALYDINTLIDPTDFWYGKWHFNEAVDINDSGLILANGCYQPPSDLSQCTTKLSVLLLPIAH
jgi:probable HAF family extracellular repeat protein